MRRNVRALVELLAREVSFREPVLEIGAYRVEGQEEIADVTGCFPPDARYIGLDMRPGPGVVVAGDGALLPFPDDSFATVLALETLEHAPDPHGLAREAARVCRPDGVVLLTSCLDFRIHHHPHDYFRFTPSAMALFVEDFPVRVSGFQGHPKFPHSVFSLGVSEESGKGWTDSTVRDWASRLTRDAAFPRTALETFRIRLASLVHSKALRGLREYNRYEMTLEKG